MPEQGKKKKAGIIIVIVVGIAAVILFAGYLLLRDKIALKNQVQRLVNDNYSYTLEYQVEGLSTEWKEGSLKGTILGTKGDSILYGALSTENVRLLDFYVDSDKNIVFNAKPILEGMLSDLSQIPVVGQLTKLVDVDDFYFSIAQVEQITGEKIVSLEDAGVSKNLFEAIEGKEGAMKAAFSLKEKKNVPENQKLLGEDACYFEIVLESYGSTVLIGIPKDSSQNEISLVVSKGDVIWFLKETYEETQNVIDEMPEETFTDEQIENLSKIYAYWKEWKQNE